MTTTATTAARLWHLYTAGLLHFTTPDSDPLQHAEVEVFDRLVQSLDLSSETVAMHFGIVLASRGIRVPGLDYDLLAATSSREAA